MIEFREVRDTDPALGHSPMVRAIGRIFDFIAELGGIELTPSKTFRREFVHWAAAEFAWPGYTEADLFALNKVLNEIDFPPLMELHGLMLALRLGRHYKGEFRLTTAGRSLIGHPGRIFGIVTPFYLFHVDHLQHARFPERPLGNWDVFLNVLNVEAEDGISGLDARRVLFGDPDPADRFDTVTSSLYVQVLRPLCWTGLLQEVEPRQSRSAERVLVKTPLWRAALRLDTDDAIRPAVRH